MLDSDPTTCQALLFPDLLKSSDSHGAISPRVNQQNILSLMWAERYCSAQPASDVNLLRDFKGVVNLNAKISDSTFDFGVPKKQLNGPQISSSLID